MTYTTRLAACSRRALHSQVMAWSLAYGAGVPESWLMYCSEARRAEPDMNTKLALRVIPCSKIAVRNQKYWTCKVDFQGIQAECSFAPTTMLLEKLNECCATNMAGFVQDPRF